MGQNCSGEDFHLRSESCLNSGPASVKGGGSRRQGFALNFVACRPHHIYTYSCKGPANPFSQIGSLIVVWPSWLSPGAWKHSLVETEVLVASVNLCGTFRPSELDVALLFSPFSTLASLFFPTQSRRGDKCHSWT